MDSLKQQDKLQAAILNAAYLVRHYARARDGGTPTQCALRHDAIQRMGEAVRDALNQCEDYEAILGAIVIGLSHHDSKPF